MKLMKLIPLGALILAMASCNRATNEDTSILHDARVGYQIFVNTFANGDKENDLFDASGDIKGIIDNLDYLKDNLNIDVLWLTPVHPSGSYHGYDVDDYMDIRDSFGGMDAYINLLDEAHKRDIKIMMDLVINHTSKNNEWFIKSADKDPDFRDFYHWTKTRVTNDRYMHNGEWYYALFWDGMPDLNYDNPKTYEAMLDVCKFWLDKGVDGFRVDGAKHVYNYDNSKGYEIYEGENLNQINYNKTLEFFNKLNKDLKNYNKNTFLTLEILENSAEAYYSYYEEGVDSTFDFETKNTIISQLSATSAKNIPSFYQMVYDEIKTRNPNALNSLVLSNHDMERVMDKLNYNEERAKAACAIEMLLPGLSWIYNGDELGMTGKSIGNSYGDLGYRQPYKWGNEYDTDLFYMPGNKNNGYDEHNKALPSACTQLMDPDSMLNFYKNMTKYKANIEAFKNGEFEPVSAHYNVCAFLRYTDKEKYLVLVNSSKKSAEFELDYSNMEIDFNYKNNTINGSNIKMEPYGISIIKIK